MNEETTTQPAKNNNELPKKKLRFIESTKAWFGGLTNLWKIILLALFVVVIAVAAFFILRAVITTSSEQKMHEFAERYYKEKIETAEKRSSSYTLVLRNMQKIGYDVSAFENAGCSLDSYAVIQLGNPNDTDTKNVTYSISTKLIGCE